VREWPVRAVAAPVLHVFWLDRPPLDSATRRALAKAFDEASQYDEATRTVRDVRRPSSHGLFVSTRPLTHLARHRA
jgi:hypothetical protein